jgi:hypothetical protein
MTVSVENKIRKIVIIEPNPAKGTPLMIQKKAKNGSVTTETRTKNEPSKVPIMSGKLLKATVCKIPFS